MTIALIAVNVVVFLFELSLGRAVDAFTLYWGLVPAAFSWVTVLTSMFGEMVKRMKSIDEGGSTLLDNTMLLYTSYMADGGHGKDDYPVVLAGNAQKTLKTGRHVAFPKKTPMSNLYVEMLDRMGVKAGEFGESKVSKHAAFDGRLPGLA